MEVSESGKAYGTGFVDQTVVFGNQKLCRPTDLRDFLYDRRSAASELNESEAIEKHVKNPELFNPFV